jgi:hypothetical protein
MPRDKQRKVIELMNVTSIMKTAQHNDYREQMREHFRLNGIDLRYFNEPPL